MSLRVRTALHEAGHSICGVALGRVPERLLIVGDEQQGYHGRCELPCLDPRLLNPRTAAGLQELEFQAVIACAGLAAERLGYGEACAIAAKLDLLRVGQVWTQLGQPATFEALYRRAGEAAEAILRRHWPAVCEVTETLASYGEIRGACAVWALGREKR